jgi:hypothetical protein
MPEYLSTGMNGDLGKHFDFGALAVCCKTLRVTAKTSNSCNISRNSNRLWMERSSDKAIGYNVSVVFRPVRFPDLPWPVQKTTTR